MAQYMKEEQQRSFPTNLDEKPEKEDVEHIEAITLMIGGEFEEPIRQEEDSMELKELVAKEEESTSSKTNEMIEEVVETISEMTL